MIIGAHVSAAGGILNAIDRATAIGANAIQIFASAPQNWNPSRVTLEEAETFGTRARENGIDYIFFHAIYLINMASANHVIAERSIESLASYMNINAATGGNGVVFHVGSTKGDDFNAVKRTVVSRINKVLHMTNPASRIVIETNAGQGNCIGDTFEEVSALLDDLQQPDRVMVCLDTAHAFASGYNWVDSGAEAIISQFGNVIGLDKLAVIHANDSKSDFNSHIDRHENIGLGKIGDKPFRDLLHDKRLAKVPFILEVPGMEKTGPDAANIKKLKQLAK